MHRKTLLISLLALACSPAFADVGAGLQVGTSGYGIDLGYQLSESFGARLGYAGFNYSKSMNSTDVDYDAKLKMSATKVLIDWDIAHGFRISGGLVFNSNKVDVTGRPTGGVYTINGHTYQGSEVGSLDGQIKPSNSVAPYLGIGYGMIGKSGLGFFADLGAYYQGKLSTNVNVTCGTALSAAQCTQLRSDVAVEQQKVQDKINGYKWYPVLSIGLSYAF
jgi:hypothetical protein